MVDLFLCTNFSHIRIKLKQMAFANKYLNKLQQLYKLDISATPADITVVIPCYNEPDIAQLLQSIWQCDTTHITTDIIVVVNESELSKPEVCQQNDLTVLELHEFAQQNNSNALRFKIIEARAMPKKWAGVGLARKTGMDAAIWQYNKWEKPDGILVSLDADCIVEQNYLQAIYVHFKKNPKCMASTIHFEHPLPNDLTLRQGIVLYELYMRYYKHALTFAGLPNAIYTIGSAFAVRAEAYVKQGGMSRNKAGEDFYFLQKQVQLGFVDNIQSTTVYPAARLSDRVPFGTGPVLQKWSKEEENLELTYPLQSFIDLKAWFVCCNKLYSLTKTEIEKLISTLPESVQSFLKENNWIVLIEELKANCSSEKIFHKRFFHLFNAFQALKFLNHCKARFYSDAPLVESTISLLKYLDVPSNELLNDAESLLVIMRNLDK
ncbi:glycosyltransferase [Prolixibacteraceae bacterium JC049]|nr:glycosyltransferase [Prolixibacteraceae bacterium JC049]